MTIEEVNNDALIRSVRSAMLLTMLIQMCISLTVGITIHVLAATMIGDTVPRGIWFLGICMEYYVVSAPFWMWKLRATQSSQPPPRTDLDAILQFDATYETGKTLILQYFRHYNYSCSGMLAGMTFLLAVIEVPNVIIANRMDLIKWPIIFGLVAFLPLLACFVYNVSMLGKYEEKLKKKNSVFERGIRRGPLPVGLNETVRFEPLPCLEPTPDQTLDTVLRNN